MKIYGTVVKVHFHTSTPRRWEKQPPDAPCFHPRITLDSVQKRKISAPTRSFCTTLTGAIPTTRTQFDLDFVVFRYV